MAQDTTSRSPGLNPPAEHAASPGVQSYSATQLFFISRLSSLTRLRRERLDKLAPDSWKMRLINKAIFSTYRDCVLLGIGEDARGLFDPAGVNRN